MFAEVTQGWDGIQWQLPPQAESDRVQDTAVGTRTKQNYSHSCSKPQPSAVTQFLRREVCDYLTGAHICTRGTARAHLIFHAPL